MFLVFSGARHPCCWRVCVGRRGGLPLGHGHVPEVYINGFNRGYGYDRNPQLAEAVGKAWRKEVKKTDKKTKLKGKKEKKDLKRSVKKAKNATGVVVI